MGFYHPATLVKDAQRRGVRFQPIDVQVSDWDCTVEADGAIRLGLRYVSGLRQEVGQAIAAIRRAQTRTPAERRLAAMPTGRRADPSALSQVRLRRSVDARARPTQAGLFCNICSHDWTPRARRRVPPLRLARRPRRAHRPAPRRSSSRWPTSARSTRSATIAARRCGRPSAPCARRASCSTNTTIAERTIATNPDCTNPESRNPESRHRRAPCAR